MNITASTRANLANLSGDATLTAAIAADVADLLRGDGTVSTDDEQAVLTAALTTGLTIAGRRFARSISKENSADVIEDAARLATETLAAFTDSRPSGAQYALDMSLTAEAITFQLTDLDDQD